MLDTAEQITKARKAVFDGYVSGMVKFFEDHQAKFERTEKQTIIGGKQASGVRLRADTNQGPRNLDVYTVVLGRRLVLVTLTGFDTEQESAASAWAIVRSSLKVQ